MLDWFVVPTFLSLTGAVLAQSAMRRRDSIPKEDYAWGWKWRERKMQSRSLRSGLGQRKSDGWACLEFVFGWRERERESNMRCNSGSFVKREKMEEMQTVTFS